MPNFSIKYSYVDDDDLIHHQTAIVRASNVVIAKDKLVRFLTRSGRFVLKDFEFLKISLSSYNLILS